MDTATKPTIKGLSRKQLSKLLPGPKLDAIIGEAVFGFSLYHYNKDFEENCYFMLLDKAGDAVKFYPRYRDGEHKTEELAWQDCPAFSTDLQTSWQVWEWLQKQRFYIGGHVEIGSNSDGYWIGPAVFCREVMSETLPLALCRAALDVRMDILEGLEQDADLAED